MIKKLLFKNLLLALVLAVVVMPVPVYAQSATADGSVTLYDLTFSGPALTWNPDFQSSFSGAQVTLNGEQTDLYFSNQVGGFVATSASAFLPPIGPASVTGSASTGISAPPTGAPGLPFATAAANINLSSLGNASVDVAQGVFSGNFIPGADGLLTITALYHFGTLSVFNSLSPDLNVYVDALASLLLDELDGDGNPTGTTQYLAQFGFLSLAGLGGPSSSSIPDGQLSITMPVFMANSYDFEAGASATASVPEPMSLILLGGGVLGLAILRKRIA